MLDHLYPCFKPEGNSDCIYCSWDSNGKEDTHISGSGGRNSDFSNDHMLIDTRMRGKDSWQKYRKLFNLLSTFCENRKE